MRKAVLIVTLISTMALPVSARINGWIEPSLSAYPPARSGHTMVNLNGEVHVFGGEVSNATTGINQPTGMVQNDLWRLNEEQAKWEERDAVAPPPARHYHAATVYNGKMYASFGRDTKGS